MVGSCRGRGLGCFSYEIDGVSDCVRDDWMSLRRVTENCDINCTSSSL